MVKKAKVSDKLGSTAAPVAPADEKPVTAPVQAQDATHGITGKPVGDYVAPSGGFPKSQLVYQADEAEKGDFIVEYVENEEYVKFHAESGGKFHPLNEQRNVATLHTRLFSPKHREDAKADAEDFASGKKGAKIFKK